MRPAALLVVVACSQPPHRPEPPARPTARTGEGDVLGSRDADGVESYLGIPYAAPPVGPLRWRDPQPPRPHPPLEAAAFHLPCSQIPLPDSGDHVTSADTFRAVVEKEWGKDAKTLVDRYPVTNATAVDQLAALYSDWGMTCPVRRDARHFAAAGVPTYLYRFRRAPPVLGGKAGAFHGAELVYLFPSVFAKFKPVYTRDDDRVAEIMIGYWSRFAATGDPNGGGAPVWPRYDPKRDEHLDVDLAPRTGSALRRAECDTWDGLGR